VRSSRAGSPSASGETPERAEHRVGRAAAVEGAPVDSDDRHDLTHRGGGEDLFGGEQPIEGKRARLDGEALLRRQPEKRRACPSWSTSAASLTGSPG